jgi:hypothetical protein
MTAVVIYTFTLAKQGLADALDVSNSALHVPLGIVIFFVYLGRVDVERDGRLCAC